MRFGDVATPEDCVGSVDIRDMLCVGCRSLPSPPAALACGHIACSGCVVGGTDVPPHEGTRSSTKLSCPECEIPVLHGVGEGVVAVCSVLELLLARASEMDGTALRRVLEEAKRQADAPTIEAARDMKTGTENQSTECMTDDVDRGSVDRRRDDVIMDVEATDDSGVNSHIHFGIGCDGCGLFPIHGRAYRCLDCPEDIGFDVCGECMRRDLPRRVTTGRFNQTHEPHHRMRERSQETGILHALVAANPTLTPHQIVEFMEMEMANSWEEPGAT